MSKYKVTGQLAVDSPDHTHPFGVMHNNSHTQEFNDRIYELFPNHPIRVMDIGCAGGHSVLKFLEQGYLAIGLEGSDYRRVHGLPEWNKIPDNLFICDVTKDFAILEDNKPAKFDVITSWEFLEHIHRQDLPKLYSEIKRYLASGGAWIVSICVFDQERSDNTKGVEWGPKDEYPGKGFHHQWCVPREWWYKDLQDNGFTLNWDKLKVLQDCNGLVRGPGILAAVDCTINLWIEVNDGSK